MAITADINLGNGVSATSTYIIIPCSQVMKYKTDVGDMVETPLKLAQKDCLAFRWINLKLIMTLQVRIILLN
jgi:hypothetical protein